jgi:glycosyltransferase involved in cell wall biosynthesis
MRIAYVCSYYLPAYVYGGPVNAGAALCEGMVHEGAEVTVLTTNANGDTTLDVPLRQRVDLEGVSVFYFPLALGGLAYFYCPSLAEAISTRISEFDLVIAATLWGHALRPTALACIRHRVPYIIPADGQLYPWALAKKRLKKALFMRAVAHRYIDRAAGIRCTDPIEAEAVDRLGLRSPTFVVPNAIHASDFRSERGSGSWRQQMSIPTDAAILLFLGRLARIKRPDIAVEVLGAAQELPRDIHLIVVGPDEEGLTQELQEQARDLGCAARLHFTGLLSRKAVASILAEADLLVMPSEIQENFGMAAVEAMAAGVPVLVSEGIPVGRWAQKAGAGLVVSCTKGAFRMAALGLLSQPERLRTMGQVGKDLARRHFDVDVVAREMLAQCEAIIATGRPLCRPNRYQEGQVPAERSGL